jgi:2-octaprenyl-6-methoxyphenol hydroxylase
MTVCILGHNLTSLALAKALIKIGLEVDLIENKKIKAYPKSRTLGISKSNIQFFCNEISNINNLCWKINDIKITGDNDLNKELISFTNKDYLFSIIKNYELHKNLKNDLKKNKKFKEKKTLKESDYDLIINTDLNHNFTKKYFFKKIEKNYNAFAYTSILKHKKIKNNQATQVFTKNGPFAFLPISNNQTSLVYSFNGPIKLSKNKFIELTNKYNRRLEILKISEINYFPLKSSNLRSYYHKNILAFGDMLHRIHPLAGQGYNMTLRDVKTLIRIIKSKIELGLPIDQSINYEFEKKTKSQNYLFSKGIDLIYEIFNFERKLNNKLINQTISFVGKNKKLNKVFKLIADYGGF